MPELVTRDVGYTVGGVHMVGYVVTPVHASAGPGIVLVHDASGLGDDTKKIAKRYASLGYGVFAADVWGGRYQPRTGEDIGRLIGSMAGDRPTWHARIRAAHETAAAQKEFRADALATVGYCFGGSSALEHLRTGGSVRGIVSIHGGLDLVGREWVPTAAPARALLCTGADDPMATPTQWQAVKAGLASAGVDWELDLYSGTRHGFTNPASDLMPEDGFAYHPRSAARAWSSATQFLRDLFADEKHDQ